MTMTKVIAVCALRSGLGKTTVASILGMTLSEHGKKVLMIDNNTENTDLDLYLRAEAKYCVDDIKPYLHANTLNSQILKSLTTEVNKELFIIAGTKLGTTESIIQGEDINIIKEASKYLFDYIIIDTSENINNEINKGIISRSDYFAYVMIPNETLIKRTIEVFVDLKEDLDQNKELSQKSLVILNRFSKDIEINNYFIKKIGQKEVHKIHNNPQVANFCNGFKLALDEQSNKEVQKIIEKIAEDIEFNENNKKNFSIKKALDKLKSVKLSS